MKKSNVILPILLALFISRCFCAEDMNSHNLSPNNAFPLPSNTLCFDLVAPAIECIEKYSKKRDDYIRKFRTKPQPKDRHFALYLNKNAVWTHIGEDYEYKYCSTPFIREVIQDSASKRKFHLTPCDPTSDYWSHGATPKICSHPRPSIHDFAAPYTYYFTLLHASTLRFAHRKDSPSKSIIAELIKAGASLTKKDRLRPCHDEIIGCTPGYSGNTPLDLLTKDELQLLVQDECKYIQSAYTNLRHCAALILRRRDHASGLPHDLLIEIMNHAIGTELSAHNYGKILDKVHCTHEDANSADFDDQG